ncbi:MAG: flagellar hook-length control protein FliK [Treponema sp.]|nr:flagellar hook-length control protein FliK [Treponema sp.]
MAATNSNKMFTVSHQRYSVEGRSSGEGKYAKGVKKGALGVFAKLLAGLTRKTKAGEAGEIEPGGLAGPGKIAGAARNGAAKKAEFPAGDKNALAPGNEKIQNRDRRFLPPLKGEGEAPSPETTLKEALVKKTKQLRENPDGEENIVLAAAEVSSALPGNGDPLLQSITPEEAADMADQDSMIRLAGAEDQFQDAWAFREITRDTPGEGADTAANAESSRLAQGPAQMNRRGPGVEKKEKAAAAEAKNSKKARGQFSLAVQDLRTGENGAALNPGQETKPAPDAGAERVADIAVELRNNGRNREYLELGQEKSAGQAFEDILARELHQNLNGDIVRQASIMVRDGGEGTIKLSLKPESLGIVKIRLEMAENKITGHIIVESNEALRAFEREIRSLEQAFRDSGFAGASLDMALAGDGGQSSSQGRWNSEAPFFPAGVVSSSYNAMAETADLFSADAGLDGFDGPGVSRVNVLV